MWERYLRGESGLIHSATGYGKTYAAWFGPLLNALETGDEGGGGLRVLWITPLRALVNDTVEALRRPLEDLGIPWTVERRTGDTSSDVKSRQRDSLPEVLVTTPESLSLLITYKNLRPEFDKLEAVFVDEWHELLGSKRGTQTELGLARMRRWRPGVRICGVSATISNLDEALRVLVGTKPHEMATVVRGRESKTVIVDALLPDVVERFEWTGHVGKNMAPAVAREIDQVGSCLVLRHHPEISENGLVLAGHLHPSVRLRGPGRDSLSLPCFHVGSRILVLPAFTRFSGGHPVSTRKGDRVFAIADESVLDVTALVR
ncbi:MAG: ATP-dependent Lhr-like helicase [Rhodothermales bacterium]